MLSKTIGAGLEHARKHSVPVYTFALYYDHESPAVAVCIDTEENSRRVVREINSYNNKYFMKYAASGNLKEATLWQANVGRNLSLGDFAHINVGRTELEIESPNEEFFATLLQALAAQQEQVAKLATDRDRLLLCCSGPNDEVGLVWSVLTNGA